MKKHALILACTAALLTSPLMAETRISFDFFYDSLSPHGDWSETDGYGRVWQPRGVDRDWSPYSDGYWSYTDAGWTWVSYEDFGGITYHYGRWVQLDEAGWCWVPGYEWGPAWVSWRKSEDYIGWAPLPPEARWEVRTGFSSWVDTHYDIGPGYYSFCHTRDFGAPVIRHVIVPRTRNVTIINVTNNITNITYNRDNGYIFNGGLDYDYIAPRCSHSLPALKLVQNTTNNIFINNNKGNVFVNTQRGNALYVSAPPLAESNYNVLTRQTAPARVYKAPTISRGWAGLDKDGVREKLLVKMRDEVKGATPDSAPARAFRAESIAVVPKKADPSAPRPSLLKATVNRGEDRGTEGPSLLKKPISRPEAPRIDKEDMARETVRPIINPDSRAEVPKQQFKRPQVSTNTPDRDDKPEILKRPVTRPDADKLEKDAPVRITPTPTVLKKPREDAREIPERPIAKPSEDNDLRKKMTEQAEREKSERAAQESRSRELAKQRESENERRVIVEKQRRASEQADSQRQAEESARRKQADAAENNRRSAEVEKMQRKQAAANEQQRRAAESEKMQRKQIESQRAAEENSRRQQSATVEKQRRAEQDNSRRAQEENSRRSAAESQQRMQQEMARRASDEARQRQAAEASRRAQAPQRPESPPQRPSGGSSSRNLTPEEQAALLKKKSSR